MCVTYLEGGGQLGSASSRGILLSQGQLCLHGDTAGFCICSSLHLALPALGSGS